jgi:hypothetical protein
MPGMVLVQPLIPAHMVCWHRGQRSRATVHRQPRFARHCTRRGGRPNIGCLPAWDAIRRSKDRSPLLSLLAIVSSPCCVYYAAIRLAKYPLPNACPIWYSPSGTVARGVLHWGELQTRETCACTRADVLEWMGAEEVDVRGRCISLSLLHQCPATHEKIECHEVRKSLFCREADGGFGALLLLKSGGACCRLICQIHVLERR